MSPVDLRDILEKDWQKTVRDLAARLGYRRAYHTYDSRRSDTGFPDLVLVRDRVVFLELKREEKHCTQTQLEWIAALHAAGADVYVVRPRNFDALAAALGPRSTSAYERGRRELLAELDAELQRGERRAA